MNNSSDLFNLAAIQDPTDCDPAGHTKLQKK